MGKIKVLSTPAGQTLRALVNDGVKIGISSRGLGSVTQAGGHVVVQDDFQLICFDVVSDPSTPKAFMDEIVMENRLTRPKNSIINIVDDIFGEQMKREDLKKMLKPLVQECVREALYEGGLLSGIVSEVAKGMGTPTPQPQAAPAPQVNEQVMRERKNESSKENNCLILSVAMLSTVVDVFEGTTPIVARGSAQHSPLAHEDPGDPGVDISNLFAGNGRGLEGVDEMTRTFKATFTWTDGHVDIIRFIYAPEHSKADFS